MTHVGFIGLGAMGRPMARNVMTKGFKLSVLKGRAAAAVEALAQSGAGTFDTGRDMARSVDVMILMLPSSIEVEDMIFRDDGILAGAHPGLTVIDMGTSNPASTIRIAEALEKTGASFVDAPVTKGVKGAETATLTLMVGASPTDLQRCRPILEAMSSQIFLAGPVGMGHLFKLMNQLVCIANLAVVAEAFAFAEAQGADLDLLFNVLRSGSAASYMLEGQVPDFLTRKYGPRFIMRLAKKDLDLVSDLADARGLPLPLTSFIRQFFQIGMRRALGEQNESAIFEVWRDLLNDHIGSDRLPTT